MNDTPTPKLALLVGEYGADDRMAALHPNAAWPKFLHVGPDLPFGTLEVWKLIKGTQEYVFDHPDFAEMMIEVARYEYSHSIERLTETRTTRWKPKPGLSIL